MSTGVTGSACWRLSFPLAKGQSREVTSSSLTDRRIALSGLLGSGAQLASIQSAAEIATQFQGYVPERRAGDLNQKLGQILDPASPASSTLPALFALTAFFASNNGLSNEQMDAFLQWIIKEQYSEFLARFMEIQAPTVHAFAKTLFESAIRIKSVTLLDFLLNCGLEFGSVLKSVALIGDHAFTKRVLAKVGLTYFKTSACGELFHHFVKTNLFDLAKILLDKGVSVDFKVYYRQTALFVATGDDDIERVKFLVESGADINANCQQYDIAAEKSTPFRRAVLRKKPDFVAILLAYNPSLSFPIEGKSMEQWASLHCKRTCDLLRQHMGPAFPGVLLGDLLEAASLGSHDLASYVNKQPNGVSQRQLEQVLEESIIRGWFLATTTLLEWGVDPNGFTLDKLPIRTALEKQRWHYVDILLHHGASATEPGLLTRASLTQQNKMMTRFLEYQHDPKEKMQALVSVAGQDAQNVVLADILLRAGTNIDTPGLQWNPLQLAASWGYKNMVSFLIHRGANINAAAHPDGGRTALQAAMESEYPYETADLLLHHGADISAPPAVANGLTVLEAFCRNCFVSSHDGKGEAFCERLLDAGAAVNRPGGKPSSVLHGVIYHGWHKALARCLETQYNTVADYIWCDEDLFDDSPDELRPCTPTQLAASNGDLKAVKMLFEYGTNVNELPGDRFGRTSLQSACGRSPSPSKTELVNFLLEQGADINAEAGLRCGVTALQAAAITGDLKLVELLISRGANVNAMPSFEEGRYAIEGAAEHGRLDTVKLLLNAGATGNCHLGTGFEYAIELAEENGHFAVAHLLKTEGPDYLAIWDVQESGIS